MIIRPFGSVFDFGALIATPNRCNARPSRVRWRRWRAVGDRCRDGSGRSGRPALALYEVADERRASGCNSMGFKPVINLGE